MTASSPAFLNPNSAIIPCFKMATQAVLFTVCKRLWSTTSRATAPHYPHLLLLTYPRSQKCDSSLNQISSRKSGSSSILFSNHWHISKRFSMSAVVSLCLIWILYRYSWRSFFKNLCNDARERPSSWERVRRNLFGVLLSDSLTASTLSEYLAVNFLPDL